MAVVVLVHPISCSRFRSGQAVYEALSIGRSMHRERSISPRFEHTGHEGFQLASSCKKITED